LRLLENTMTGLVNPAPIGVFDSGVGGLSVLKAIRAQLPAQPVFYFADQAHVPYGSRSLEEVRSFSSAITEFLLGLGSAIIVVACNTASAAALQELRVGFPSKRFVGMEPAVKPAAEQTRTGVVGVLATPATFQGRLYSSVVERFAKEVILLQDTCPGLVGEIEKGNLGGAETRRILESAILPMLEKNIDTIVLGCTHYPLVIPLIRQIAGDGVNVIDPAPAIARQIGRVLDSLGITQLPDFQANVSYYTSGTTSVFEELLPRLLGEGGEVNPVSWNGYRLAH
jgi:glutamate racemase